MVASEVKLILAGMSAVIVFLAAPAAVAYIMWMLGVVAAGPVAGGFVAWLMQMGAPMWLVGLLQIEAQAVGMAGLGAVGAALFAIMTGSAVLVVMDGCGYSCAPFPCSYVPCNLV
uniref:Uncharacterized protein n=1 Tax=Plectus sambesii TaxID=2011161 RepID=A0A914WLN5_9BILA